METDKMLSWIDEKMDVVKFDPVRRESLVAKVTVLLVSNAEVKLDKNLSAVVDVVESLALYKQASDTGEDFHPAVWLVSTSALRCIGPNRYVVDLLGEAVAMGRMKNVVYEPTVSDKELAASFNE